MATSDSQSSALADRLDPIPQAYFEPPDCDGLTSIDRDESALLLDGLLHRLAGREARCRLSIGRHCVTLLATRAHRQLGFARLNDYTLERLGISEREVQSLAQVYRIVARLPALGLAFQTGRINWSKLRLLGDVADESDVAHWIDIAAGHSVRELASIIAAWKRERDGSTEAQAAGTDDLEEQAIDGETRAVLRLRCPAHLRSLFRQVSELASRMNGSLLAPWQALESIAAEALSGASPIAAPDATDLARTWDADALAMSNMGLSAPHSGDALDAGRMVLDDDGAWGPRDDRADDADEDMRRLREHVCRTIPHDVDLLAVLEAGSGADTSLGGMSKSAGLDGDASARLESGTCGRARHEPSPHDLDARLRSEIRASQDVDWQMGRLLATFKRLRLYRNAGFARFEDYVRERVGISKSKADALVRLEGRLSEGRQQLGAAYRSGELSWARAHALLPVLSERDAAAWIERAKRVTFRRLREEVRWGGDMRDRGVSWMPIAPPPLGAKLEFSDAEAARQMCARFDADTAARMLLSARSSGSCHALLRIAGPASVIALARDAMSAYAAAGEAPWRSFERILLAAQQAWQTAPEHRDPIFRRDNWQCRVPGCSSRRNLHDHHIVFRSQGGGNERPNRVSVCATHHHHGIHAGVIRAHGDADGEIHWQLGLPRSSFNGSNGSNSSGREPLLRTRNDVYA
jgi:hypothetical protein